MRTDSGAYRFSLQFPSQTEQQRYVGKHLEGLGSKKSSFIVEALYEHLTRSTERKQEIVGFSRSDLKDIIREVLAERGMVIQLPEDLPAKASSES